MFYPCAQPNLNFTNTIEMKSTEVQFAYNYTVTINVLSKCSNIISHRSSVFEGRQNDHRSSKVGTSIIHLRRSTHLSSILESRHIDRRSSKVDTSIFEGRHIDLRRSTHRASKIEGGNIAPTTQHRTNNPTSHRHSDNSSPNIVRNGAPQLSVPKIPRGIRIILDEGTHARTHNIIYVATAPHVH